MQESQYSIRVKELGKCYPLYQKPHDRLKRIIWNRNKNASHDFWALSDISFDVKKGESLGIIGRNGSGKSTLLQILCKTLTPTTGSFEINGSIAALLELGAGFNPEFTGKENIYLNGAILGFTKKQMDELYEEIISFADIGEYIDQPIKKYSSGMFVRLAFAIQACVRPDILIVDEALSVGDIFFQQKCANRMNQLREQGTTLIFVSHDMATVRDLCDKAIYLKSGKMIYSGSSIEAIRKYFAEMHDEKNSHHLQKNLPIQPSKSIAESIAKFKESACWLAKENDNTEKKAKLIAIAVEQNHLPSLQTTMGGNLKFKVLYQAFTEEPIHITIALRNRYDHIIHSSGTYTNNVELPALKIGEFAIFEMDISCMIEAGLYTFCVFLSHILAVPNRGNMLDESSWIGPITVTWDYENDKAPWLGMFGMPTKARISDLKRLISETELMEPEIK